MRVARSDQLPMLQYLDRDQYRVEVTTTRANLADTLPENYSLELSLNPAAFGEATPEAEPGKNQAGYWFLDQLPSSRTLRIRFRQNVRLTLTLLHPGPNRDLFLELLNKDGEVIKEADDPEQIEETLDPGVYTVRATSLDFGRESPERVRTILEADLNVTRASPSEPLVTGPSGTR